MFKRYIQNGFTLVELIVVIVILAVLAAISFMMVTKWINKSSNARAASDVGTITRALHGHYSEKGTYPETSKPIGMLSATGLLLGEQGVFDEEVIKTLGTFSKLPKDPKANDYYLYTTIKNPAKGFEVGAVFENPEISVLGTKVYADGAVNAIPYIQSNYHGKYYNESGIPIFPKPLSVFDQSSGKYLQESTIGVNGELVIDMSQLTGKQLRTFNADGIMVGGEYGDFIVPKVGYIASGADSSFSTGVIMQALPQNVTSVTTNSSSSLSSVMLPVDGVCGSSNGQMFFDIVPSINLCSQGTNTSVSTVSTGYVWNCNGLNGGGNIACSAGNELNKWTTKTVLPVAKYNIGFGGAYGNKIYAFGGRDSSTLYTSVHEFNIDTNIWTTKTSMSAARNAIGVGAISNKIYVIGGRNSTNGYFKKNEFYDAINDTWNSVADLPVARGYLGVAVHDGKIYVFGGMDSTNAALSKNEMYDPSLNTWTSKANMPTARYFPGVGVINGIIYVCGGSDSSNNVLKKLEAYNPITNTWTTLADMPTARRGLSVAVVNNKLYAIGGGNSSSAFNVIEVYDPLTNTWSSLTGMPVSRGWFGGGVINNRIYIIGGTDSTTAYNTNMELGW